MPFLLESQTRLRRGSWAFQAGRPHSEGLAAGGAHYAWGLVSRSVRVEVGS